MDVLSASSTDHKIAWYENTDGAGNFGSQQIITTNANGAGSVYAEDLDGDGDMDVLSASQGDGKIAWYENLGVTTAIENNTVEHFNVYPNPTTDLLTIEPFIPDAQIEIFDLTGQVWSIQTYLKMKLIFLP